MEYVGYLLMGGLILFFAWVFWQMNEFKKHTNNAVLCTIVTDHNSSYDQVLPIEGRIIKPPYGRWLKKKDKRNWGMYVLPELPEDIPTVKYPLGGWPMSMRADIRRVFLKQTDAVSFSLFNPLDQNSGMTPQALQAMINPAIVESLLRPEGDAIKDATSGKGSALKGQNKIFYMLIAVLGGILVVGVLCWMIYSALSGHITAWGA